MSNMKNICSKNENRDEREPEGVVSRPDKGLREVPRHPKWCPDCLGKGQRSEVKIFNLNEDNEAIYMCSNMQVIKALYCSYLICIRKINVSRNLLRFALFIFFLILVCMAISYTYGRGNIWYSWRKKEGEKYSRRTKT